MDLLALLEQREIVLPAQSDSAEIALDDVLVQVLAVLGDDDRPVQAGLGVHPVAALLAGEMKAEEKENAIEHSPWDGGYARHSRGWLPARNGRESSMWLGPSSRFSSLPVAGRKPASLRTVSRVPIS